MNSKLTYSSNYLWRFYTECLKTGLTVVQEKKKKFDDPDEIQSWIKFSHKVACLADLWGRVNRKEIQL